MSLEALGALGVGIKDGVELGPPPPLQRGLISLGVIPLAKDLMMAEGREVPLEGQALFSSRPVALVPGRRL